MLLNQKPIHSGMIAAETHEYINVFFLLRAKITASLLFFLQYFM